jgi:membrane-bound metal-dependent hydrolase YbcI (DUF457 family)
MDIGTHTFVSIALVRAVWPRAPRVALPIAVAAGLVADLDALSALSGPSAYLAWHRTYTHSLLATLVFAAVFGAGYRFLAPRSLQQTLPFTSVSLIALLAEWLHLAMDSCQWESVELYWPFTAKRIDADWLGTLDPYILALLAAGILLPELLHLVSSEIGAKDKKPRGQAAAMLSFGLLLLYGGFRAVLHSRAVAILEARTYHGEIPRRVAAYPLNISPATWTGVVETDRTVEQLTVNTGFGSSTESARGFTLYKPEPSPVLDAAQGTTTAKGFLAGARFPKASVGRTENGYTVELRDLRYAATSEAWHEVAAIVSLDAAAKVIQEELVWARNLHHR